MLSDFGLVYFRVGGSLKLIARQKGADFFIRFAPTSCRADLLLVDNSSISTSFFHRTRSVNLLGNLHRNELLLRKQNRLTVVLKVVFLHQRSPKVNPRIFKNRKRKNQAAKSSCKVSG